MALKTRHEGLLSLLNEHAPLDWVLRKKNRHGIEDKMMREPKFLFRVLDASKNRCMLFKVYDESNVNKTRVMEIESLKYEKGEHRCRVSGEALLSWSQELCHKKVVDCVRLTDVSYKLIRGHGLEVRVPLTLFAKFAFDRGWYEKFDFFPVDRHEYEEFNDSFHRIQTADFDEFLLFLLRLTLHIDQKRQYRDAPELSLDVFANFNLEGDVDLLDFEISKTELRSLYSLVERFGFSKIHVLDVMASIGFQPWAHFRGPSGKNVRKALTPTSYRKVWKKIVDNDVYSDVLDIFDYLKDITNMLRVLYKVGVLKKPLKLQFSVA